MPAQGGTNATAAILLGVAVVAVLTAITAVMLRGKGGTKGLLVGADGRMSLSKFQAWLWTCVVAGSYIAVYQHAYVHGVPPTGPADIGIPANLMLLMALSVGTALAAKVVTTSKVTDGSVVKSYATGTSWQDMLLDDQGRPDLTKAQMFWWTLLSVGIYIAELCRQLQQGQPEMMASISLPDVGQALMVLMGISQGFYIGKKLVTTNTPVISATTPPGGAGGTLVEISGTNFGDNQMGGQMLFDNTPAAVTQWGNTLIKAAVPAGLKAGNVMVTVIANGQSSNAQPFAVSA